MKIAFTNFCGKLEISDFYYMFLSVLLIIVNIQQD